METRRNSSIIFVPESEEEMKIWDQVLGNCGPGPIELKGVLKMSDEIGPSYVRVWNPLINQSAKIQFEERIRLSPDELGKLFYDSWADYWKDRLTNRLSTWEEVGSDVREAHRFAGQALLKKIIERLCA